MDFREISFVNAIAKYQNITKAAEALYITQPALSKFLISLEKDLGLKLFRKAGNKYILTYAGERYLDAAKKILDIKSSLDAELADIIKRDVGVLNIGMPTMRCTYMLPKTLPEFEKFYPNVKINLFEGNSSLIDKRLIEGEIELAFYSKPNEINPLLEYETLANEELLICTCKNHKLKDLAFYNPSSPYPKIKLSLLKNERLILLSAQQRTGQISRYYLQKSGTKFENVLYIENMPAVMDLVEAGYGVAFIFESHLRYHVYNSGGIDGYSFGNPKVTSDFVAAYRKNMYLPAYARKFIEVSKQLYDKKNS